MLKLAFYIIEPLVDYEKNEFKDNESELVELNSSIQKDWTYFEDISFDYTFTQSVLFKIYGGVVQETGHKTRGHASLTEYDRYYLLHLLLYLLVGIIIVIMIVFLVQHDYMTNIFTIMCATASNNMRSICCCDSFMHGHCCQVRRESAERESSVWRAPATRGQ